MKVVTRSSLRILQWNADGLKSKSDELAARIKTGDIDLAVIQETWLTKTDSTPFIGKDYVAVREDRKVNIQRGGLIIYIKKSVNYDRLGYISSRGHEILSIRVKLTKAKWLTISNFYIPPPDSKGQIIEFNTSLFTFSAASIIFSDFKCAKGRYSVRRRLFFPNARSSQSLFLPGFSRHFSHKIQCESEKYG